MSHDGSVQATGRIEQSSRLATLLRAQVEMRRMARSQHHSSGSAGRSGWGNADAGTRVQGK